LKLYRTAPEFRAKLAGKRSETFVAYLKTYFRNGSLRRQHPFCPIHAQACQELMRGLAEVHTKKAMKVKFGKASLACRMGQQNARCVCGGEEIAPSADPAERIIV
jgi:hypothetical protein